MKQTEFVDRVVETQKPLDPRLTKAAPEPKAPPAKCVSPTGKGKVPCGKEVANYIDALRLWGRGMVKQLGEIAGLQPKKDDK